MDMHTRDIFIKNTLTGQKELFKPLQENVVKMYHCGPTVYNFAHIGNMRSYVFADIIRKTFEINSYKIIQVINITDVGHLTSDSDDGDDKVEKAAKERGLDVSEIAEFYLHAFIQDLRNLNIKTYGTHFPHASEHIKEQIDLIQKLERNGYTYVIDDDGVYFDTSKYTDYGKLGNIDIDNLKEGARIGINSQKRNITDFALWKFSKTKDKRLQEWNSPWGTGFPGWHIECSAMSMKYLGETFDIHTGGIDHIPVHHNNEIAQSVCATNKPYVKYWLHNAFLKVDDQKMSKSLGNIFTISDIKEKGFSPLSFRYWLLGGRYSSQMNFTWQALEDSENARNKIEKHFFEYPKGGSIDTKYLNLFLDAICDDFDTPKALTIVWDIIKDQNIKVEDKRSTLHEINKVLSIIDENKEISTENKELALKLIKERELSRKNNDWSKSDELRKKIEDLGYIVEDSKQDSKYLIK